MQLYERHTVFCFVKNYRISFCESVVFDSKYKKMYRIKKPGVINLYRGFRAILKMS